MLLKAGDMFPLPSSWTPEAGLSLEAGIPDLWDTLVPIISGMYIDAFCSSLPYHGPGETILVEGCYTEAYYFAVRLDGPGQGSRSRSRPGLTSRDIKDPGRVYAITPQDELADQSVIQGTFLLSRLWTRVLFDFCASHSFITTSYVKDLGLEVETSKNPLHVSSPLETRMRVNMIYRGYELEILGILLMVDLRVMDMSEFDVILGMDWLMAHRVIIDCDRRRVIAYT